MTKINKLIVSGCSFTAGISWAKFLSDHYKLDLVNLAYSGAGNSHIANSIILYLEKQKEKINKNNVLIILMWSGLFRKDWIRDENPQYNHYYTNFKYTKNTRLVNPAGVVAQAKISRHTSKTSSELDLLDIAYEKRGDSRILESWLKIDHLNCYLKLNNYQYCQTNFFDPAQDYPPTYGANYNELLNKFNLDIDYQNFINFKNSEYLGNYAFYNGMLDTTVHPTQQGHRAWTHDILINKIENLII